MKIRLAKASEVPTILEIYADARAYMRASGNQTQWEGGYPSETIVCEDLAASRLYVVEENGTLLGVFCFFLGEDPTYSYIEGAWPDDLPYGVIHRIAVAKNAHGRGVASACFAFAMESTDRLRIDTHADNDPMQRALEKNGFVRCGVIYLANGDPRYAYQKNAGIES